MADDYGYSSNDTPEAVAIAMEIFNRRPPGPPPPGPHHLNRDDLAWQLYVDLLRDPTHLAAVRATAAVGTVLPLFYAQWAYRHADAFLAVGFVGRE